MGEEPEEPPGYEPTGLWLLDEAVTTVTNADASRPLLDRQVPGCSSAGPRRLRPALPKQGVSKAGHDDKTRGQAHTITVSPGCT